MSSRRAKVRRKVYNRIPMWFRKNDFEIFTSLLSFSAGLPIVLGRVEPTALEATLPTLLVTAWAWILLMSPIMVITGLYKRSKRPVAEGVFWIRVEAIGLTALAYSSYIYTIAILTISPVQGWAACMMILAFGFTCHTRELGLQVKIADLLLGLGVDERERR